MELAVGGSVVAPLADGQGGLTSGAVLGRGFVGMRKNFPDLTLAGHVGFSLAEDARFGDRAEGRMVATAGVGTLLPLSRIWMLLAEFDYSGGQFEGEPSVARGLAGLDWRPFGSLVVRGGLAAGLSDGAPRWSGVGSVVFHY